jgi:hypothetical protein
VSLWKKNLSIGKKNGNLELSLELKLQHKDWEITPKMGAAILSRLLLHLKIKNQKKSGKVPPNWNQIYGMS